MLMTWTAYQVHRNKIDRDLHLFTIQGNSSQNSPWNFWDELKLHGKLFADVFSLLHELPPTKLSWATLPRQRCRGLRYSVSVFPLLPSLCQMTWKQGMLEPPATSFDLYIVTNQAQFDASSTTIQAQLDRHMVILTTHTKKWPPYYSLVNNWSDVEVPNLTKILARS